MTCAFFDSCVYIDWWRGVLPEDALDRYHQQYLVRLSPIVLLELVRGARSAGARRIIEDLTQSVILLPAPSQAMYVEAGWLSLRLSKQYSQSFTEKLQNDILIALTARATGSLLVSRDRHFETIKKVLDFKLDLLPS